MTAVEFLAERYNYITWMRNRDEISAGTADEWRAKFLEEAKKMEEQQLDKAWQEWAVTAQNDEYIRKIADEYADQLYSKDANPISHESLTEPFIDGFRKAMELISNDRQLVITRNEK